MRKYHSEILLIGLFICSAIILLTRNLWYDELLTTPLILGYNIKDMIYALRYDAHPPLYFVTLKLYTLIFGDDILTMKTFNIVIEVLIIYLCYFQAKKLGDRKLAVFVISVFVLFPAIYNEIFQIRMYSFTPFVVLLVGIYATNIYFENKSKINHFLFVLFSICAVYTHFYAIVGIALIHLMLYISLIKRNKNSLKQISLYSGLTFSSFIPWIPTFIQQVAVKKENIGDTSGVISRIFKNIMYLFYTGNYSSRDLILNYILTGILIMATVFIFILFFRKRRDSLKLQKLYVIANVAIIIPVLIMVVFSIFSLLVTPIWYARYLVIFFPLIAFSLGFIIYNLKRKYQYIYLIILVISFAQKIYSTFLDTSDNGLNDYANLIETDIQPDDIILDAGLYTSTYFSDVKQYNLKTNQSNNLVFNHIYNWNVNLVDDYREIIRDKQSFWSEKLNQDSLYIIGDRKFHIAESYIYKYSYLSKGSISIYRYKQ